jgi:transposase InsO family protein
VQQMHSDNGGEFINKDLDKFLKGKSVKQTVSTPHTSEHNEVIERMLRSIISIARLIHSGLSQQFWCEAVRYACLVHSCVPTKAVDGMTPMEC